MDCACAGSPTSPLTSASRSDGSPAAAPAAAALTGAARRAARGARARCCPSLRATAGPHGTRVREGVDRNVSAHAQRQAVPEPVAPHSRPSNRESRLVARGTLGQARPRGLRAGMAGPQMAQGGQRCGAGSREDAHRRRMGRHLRTAKHRALIYRAEPADLPRHIDSALPIAASVACPWRTRRCRGLPAPATFRAPGRVAPGPGLSHDPAQGRNTPPGSRSLGQHAANGSAAQATSGPR